MRTEIDPNDYTEAAEERSAIMEHDGELSREQADTYSHEWKMQCMARQIFKSYPTLEDRRAYLARLEKRHGKGLVDEVKGYLAAEFNRARGVA